MSARYTAEIHDFIRANVSGRSTKALAEMVNEKFGTQFTAEKMKSYKGNYKLKSGVSKGASKGSSKVFPNEIVKFIKENYKGVGPKGMTEMVNVQFNKQYTHQQIKAFYKNHGLNSGLDGRFQKGHIPSNKGKKMSPEQYERCKNTMFKKGTLPFNHMEIGEYTHTTDGYLVKKIQENGAQKERFEFVHRAVWKEHYGEIPKGKMIGFLDGNKDNCNIENLILLDREENLELNRNRMRFKNAECTKVAVSVAKIRIAMRRRNQ